MRVASIVFSCFAIVLLTVSPINAAAVALYPRGIRGAYNVNPLLQSGYTGKGVTVAIVNTGIDGTVYTSVKGFSSVYGLPDPTISVVRPYGSAGTDHETPDGETTADAELVHAMAPDAHILLVLVGTGGNLLDGFPYVIDHNAADIAVLSPSEYYWGTNARDTVESYNGKYAKSVGEKITLIAASNDWGSDNTDPWGEISGDFWTKHLPDSYLMPQYNPYVTTVGGTILTVQSMSYGSEKGWERSGGGPSNLFTQPTWQKGSGVPENGFRNIPDIALNAACETAYVVYWNVSQGTFCGTSGAAPTFAGIIADITQAAGERLGFLNPTLYSLASSDPSVYHEITSGCSLLKPNPNDPATKTGYCAHAGWNFVTGLGSIDATRLATHLAPRAHIVPATTTTTTSREHSTESTSIIRESRTESTASTNQSNVKGFEYLPYILAGLAVAALVIVGFTYARKRTTKTHSG